MAEIVKTVTIKINGQDAIVELEQIKAALKETNAETKKVEKTNLSNFSSQISNLTKSYKEGEIGLKGLTSGILQTGKALITTFISNPILLAVTAIVGAIAGLVAIFKSFKPLVDGLAQGFAGVSAAFNTFKSAVFSLISGAKSLGDSFGGLGLKMKAAAAEAAALKKAQQELEDQQAALEVQNKLVEVQIEKLILQSKNRTLTEQERIDLIDKATKMEEDQYKIRKINVDKEVANAEKAIAIKAGLNKQEREELEKTGVAYAVEVEDKGIVLEKEIDVLKNAYLKRADMESENVSMMEKAQNRRDALADKQAQNAAVAYDIEIADVQKYVDELETIITKEKEVRDNTENTYEQRKKSADSITLAINNQYTAEVKIQDLKIKKLQTDFKITQNTQDQVQIKEIQIQKEKLYGDALVKTNEAVKASNILTREQIDRLNEYDLSAEERAIREKEYTDQIISDEEILKQKTIEKFTVLASYGKLRNKVLVDIRNSVIVKPEDLARDHQWRNEIYQFDTYETQISKLKFEREKKTAEELYFTQQVYLQKKRDEYAKDSVEYNKYQEQVLNIDSEYSIKKLQFIEKERQIKKDNVESNIKNQIYLTENEINDVNKSTRERLYIIERYLGNKEMLEKTGSDVYKGFLQQEVVITNMSEQQIYETTKQYSELKKQLKKEERQKQFEGSLSLVNSIQSIDQAATDTSINLEKTKLDNKQISQEQYDKAVNKIQKKAAMREKAYAVGSTIISTAQAISGMLTVKPVTPLNFALAAAAGVLGAVQIAKIISTPLGEATSAGGSSSVSTPSSSEGTAPNTSFSIHEKPAEPVSPFQNFKTYVLSKDVQNQNQLDRAVVSNGTI